MLVHEDIGLYDHYMSLDDKMSMSSDDHLIEFDGMRESEDSVKSKQS
jgi:hypothetical protein